MLLFFCDFIFKVTEKKQARNNLQIITNGSKFEKHVSDDLHSSTVSNGNSNASRCDIN